MVSSQGRAVRFAIKRPWLFVRGLATRRANPDLGELRSIDNAERFVWRVLPHAARTFAPSIVALPYRRALPAAVAYLYARMLDTYEDLELGVEKKVLGLEAFAARFEDTALPSPPPLDAPNVQDERDLVHLLLIERCSLVDELFADLGETERRNIIEMIRAMSVGMAEAARAMDAQGNVMKEPWQVEEYCHTVIGHPISFIMRLLVGEDAARRSHADAMELSVLIQMANITRDIEKDARRGVSYHPALTNHLGGAVADATGKEAIAEARQALVRQALSHVPAYRRLIADLALPRFSLARGSAVLMGLHTDRHYRRMASLCGLETWQGPEATMSIWWRSILAVVSRSWASRQLSNIERGARSGTESAAAAH